MISSPLPLLAVIMLVPAFFIWLEKRTAWKIFEYLPPIIWVFLFPIVFSSLHVIPSEAPMYSSFKNYAVPLFIILMLLDVDIKTTLKVAGKSFFVLLAGSIGVVLGAFIAFAICKPLLPPDSWRGFGALAGSWIGGTGNMAAVADSIKTPPHMMGIVVLADTFVYILWFPLLLSCKKWAVWFNRFVRVNEKEQAMQEAILADYQSKSQEVSFYHLLVLLGFAVFFIYAARLLAQKLPVIPAVNPSEFTVADLKDPEALVSKLKQGKDPLASYLRQHFNDATKGQLADYHPGQPPSPQLQQALVTEFNKLIAGDCLYRPQLFAGVSLSGKTRRSVERHYLATVLQDNPHYRLTADGNKLTNEFLASEHVKKLNKALLNEVYPEEIGKKYAIITAKTWEMLLITTFGILLSLTPLKKVPGTNSVAMALVYCYMTMIAAECDLQELVKAPWFLFAAMLCIILHGGFCVLAARIFHVDIHLTAIASAANIGGVASAPVVAAYHKKELVPISIVLALAGYALGNYLGFLTAMLCYHIL